MLFILIWLIQVPFYFVIQKGKLGKIKKRYIFILACLSFLIYPLVFPYEQTINEETGMYDALCGFPFLLSVVIYSGIGNTGNIILISLFDWLVKKEI